MEKECWLFTLWTPIAGYINCWYEWFPSKQELINVCRKFGDKEGLYAIINVTKLTEEQYNKLTKDSNEK
jgi:hypothetical protein